MRSKFMIRVVFVSIFCLFGCAGYGDFKDVRLDVPEIVVTSNSISDGKLLTVISSSRESNKPKGKNFSPQLSWEKVPGANYYAICMFDETANWLHFFITNVEDTSLIEGQFTKEDIYIGPYPPKSDEKHQYRIEFFAIKKEPTSFIGNFDGKNSYEELVIHLNQVGGNSDNIIARGYIRGTYAYGDENK